MNLVSILSTISPALTAQMLPHSPRQGFFKLNLIAMPRIRLPGTTAFCEPLSPFGLVSLAHVSGILSPEIVQQIKQNSATFVLLP